MLSKYSLLPSRKIGVHAICAVQAAHTASSSSGSGGRMVQSPHTSPRPPPAPPSHLHPLKHLHNTLTQAHFSHNPRIAFSHKLFLIYTFFYFTNVYCSFIRNLRDLPFSVWLRDGFSPTRCLQQNIMSVTPYYALIDGNQSNNTKLIVLLYVWYRFSLFVHEQLF